MKQGILVPEDWMKIASERRKRGESRIVKSAWQTRKNLKIKILLEMFFILNIETFVQKNLNFSSKYIGLF
ncbi:MAG: hypothetical protein NZL96_01685 [Patescibacteria group bacterium]|nr:hypothetical protein [Patescibacteria group bacterium]